MKSNAVRTTLVRFSATAVLSLGAIGSAFAVDYNYEPELDAIYGQASFGVSPIDIRFLPTQTLFDTSLLSIDSEEKFNALDAIGGASPLVSAFLVNSITFCGGPAAPGTSIDGCGQTPGHILAFNYGVNAVVFAHELGHNLNLGHDDISLGNIMGSSSGFDDRLFTLEQTAAILSSPLVQTDAAGKFISIQLYNVVASVPEPSTYAMFALGLAGVGFLRKRKTAKAADASATA